MHRITEHANAALEQLRRLRSTGPLEDARRLVPGIWFSIDSHDAPVTGHVSTTEGMLLNARMHTPAQARRRWCTLNIDLGTIDPGTGAPGTGAPDIRDPDIGAPDIGDRAAAGAPRLIGFACRARAPQTRTLRAAIRSFHPTAFGDSGFTDTVFADHIVAFADDSTHCDLLWIDQHPALRTPADWRTLILFLDPQGFDILISDLRIFAA